MAGVAGTIGAKSLESAARELLQSIKQKQHAKSPLLLDAFEREHQRVVTSLFRLVKEDKLSPPLVQESGEYDVGPLKELLHTLRPALQKRNPIDCQDIMVQIADLQVPLVCSQELTELKQLLEKYQFKDAETLLTVVSGKLGEL
jgi:HPt (histidine-containing phosphotransfer) domain-containing protein